MTESNRRDFPRFKFDTKIEIDITDINENNLQCSENAFEAKTVDIGIHGIGVKFMDNIKEDIIANLLTGRKKVRLNFSFDDDSKLVNTFAITVWNTNNRNCFGLKYCDIDEDSFLIINNLVEKLKIINDNKDIKYLLNSDDALDLNIIKKPDLCTKCKYDHNPNKKKACDLTRFKQIDTVEFICSAFKIEKKSKFDSLKHIKIFARLSQKEIEIIYKFFSQLEFNPGDIILRESAFGASTYFVVSGELDVFKQKGNDTQVLIATITPGNSVGEMAMVDGYARSATVIGKTEGSLLTLDHENYIKIQNEFPQISNKIYRGITSLLCINLRNISNEMTKYKLPVI